VAPPEKSGLGELLVRQQLISEEQLEAALERRRASDHKLGRTLVDAGCVSEEQICGALARRCAFPYIDLKQFAFNAALILVTGPTGSGKTTTLYAALGRGQRPRPQDPHGRGSGRVPPAWRQPGAGAREDRARLRALG
jgi:MSHA biogenesis protein MshE